MRHLTPNKSGSEISEGSFNNRNQLTAQEAGGWMRVSGMTNESSDVRVKSNGNPFTKAQTDKDNGFFGWVETVPGQNTLTIEATDDSPNANKKTNSYTINVTGQNRSLTFDLNGNITNNGTAQTYLWDAENRLVKITYADNSKTEFQYDGLSRRTRITERNSANTITKDKRYVWLGGNQPAEERDAATNSVTKRFFAAGEQRLGGSDAGLYFYAKDHLGSVREVINASGNLATRYDYDLWGKRVRLSGTIDTEVGYTGHHHHEKSGLVLTWYRAYDAVLGRWLSPDPIGEAGGINLYEYAGGDPINVIDPYGLDLILLSPRVNGKEGNDRIISAHRIHANNNRLDGDNEFEIHGHGNCNNVFNDREAIPRQLPGNIRTITGSTNRKVISAKQLADLIQAEGSWKPGMPVTLFMCDTGTTKLDGTDNFAMALAKELAKRGGMRQEVRAPNGKCSIAKEPPYTPSVITVPPNDKRDPKFYSSYANP